MRGSRSWRARSGCEMPRAPERRRSRPRAADEPEPRGAPDAGTPEVGVGIGSAVAPRSDRPDLRLVLPGAFGWAVGWLAPVIGAGRATGVGAALAVIGVWALWRHGSATRVTVAAVCLAGAAVAVA